MGVFTNAVKIAPISFSILTITKTQILFFIGSVAIAVGIFTYSKNVMSTVGNGLYRLSPSTALIVVLSSSLVLFLFASVSLQSLLTQLHLPTSSLILAYIGLFFMQNVFMQNVF